MLIEGLEVIIDEVHLNIHIQNSFLKKSKKEIENFLLKLRDTKEFQQLQKLGYARSLKSQLREWCAHNFLYYNNLFISHTKDVDLNQNENIFRRIIYYIIYIIY